MDEVLSVVKTALAGNQCLTVYSHTCMMAANSVASSLQQNMMEGGESTQRGFHGASRVKDSIVKTPADPERTGFPDEKVNSFHTCFEIKCDNFERMAKKINNPNKPDQELKAMKSQEETESEA
eukprot:Filipodium_phascolosomae@DN3769_c0_g1_i1.p1